MKTVYFLRHAKSSWKDAKLSDIDRPLNKRGKEAAPEMAQKIRKAGLIPQLIISSPAKRTFRTASLIATGIDYTEQNIKIDMNLYGANTNEVHRIITEMEEGLDTIMLVGHNPAFTQMLSFYTDEELDNLPTCGLLEIAFDVDHWKNIQPKAGQFIQKLAPKRKSK